MNEYLLGASSQERLSVDRSTEMLEDRGIQVGSIVRDIANVQMPNGRVIHIDSGDSSGAWVRFTLPLGTTVEWWIPAWSMEIVPDENFNL